MIAYIQQTNRNSFTRRYKKYKLLRCDIWGRIALLNKKNYVTSYLKYHANQDVLSRTQQLTRRRRIQVSQNLGIIHNPNAFYYNVAIKATPPKGKMKLHNAMVRLIHKRILLFYSLRFKSKSLRKRMRTHSTISGYAGINRDKAYLEGRADVLLYRCNLGDSIRGCRRLIKYGHVFMLGPKAPNDTRFFSCQKIKKSEFQLPIFYMIRLCPAYSLIRKRLIYNYLLARNKFISLPPKWIMPQYGPMLFLLLFLPKVSHVKYLFKGTLATFLGTALYF